MRASRVQTHKKRELAETITVLIPLLVIIAASIGLSSCAGFTTSSGQTGNAASRQAQLSANPTSLNFNAVAEGTSSTLTSILTNNRNSNINISEVTVAGAGLTVAGISSGTILTPGQSATVAVTFAPAGAGTLTGASVKISSNAANSPLTIAVQGTGQTGNSVQLSWTPSTTSGVSYDIFRANTSGGYGSTPLNPSPIAATTYVDTSVVSGQTYFYVATAVDGAGSSADSNEVSVTIP